jgi:NTP pyrophosphatase (non-canonical NTP hydrolase)
MNKIEHLLCCLAEEACEVGKAAMKASRFGLKGSYDDGRNNVAAVVHELNDLLGVVELLGDFGVDFKGLRDFGRIQAKKAKILEHMEIARKNGALEADE